MSIESIEAQIKAEYSKIDAFIALHPKLTVCGVIVAAWLFGHSRWPF